MENSGRENEKSESASCALSRQAIAVLRDLQTLTGQGGYVFPSLRSGQRPMSNNTVLAALHRMGYAKEEMSGHGFHSMASTLLNEQGWNRDAIERQLAHAEGNSVYGQPTTMPSFCPNAGR